MGWGFGYVLGGDVFAGQRGFVGALGCAVWTVGRRGWFNGRVPRGLASTRARVGEHLTSKGMMSVANHNIGAA